jgi:alanyl-tRNA synthetase
MAAQKAKARAAWAGSGEMADDTIWFDVLDNHGATDFLGYDTEQAEGQIVALVQNGEQVDRADAGATVQIVLNQTPFYAESGGQIGDRGEIVTESGSLEVTDCRKTADLFIHVAKVTKGFVELGQAAELAVAADRRARIHANHSATHLLHEALRRTLGEHVAQRGSLNADDRLRFDFSHGQALTATQLQQVQSEVNAFIRQNSTVETRIMTPDDARALGAQALFGEKYGEEVRVVSMGHLSGSGKGAGQDTYSLELCGGTHVRQTGDIGGFVLLSDGASSAGVRRIEALTGEGAENFIQHQMAAMTAAANVLKVQPTEVADRAQQLLDERKALQNEAASLRRELALSGGAEAKAVEPISIGGTAFLAQVLQGVTGRDLPALVDAHKAKMGSGVVLLIADADGKAAVAAGVTGDLTEQISAVDIVKTVVATLGGKGGGGRADMAQGGAKSTEDTDAAISAIKALLEEKR